jgi:putative thioredoxin
MLDGLVARARLSRDEASAAELAPAFEAWDTGDFERALEGLSQALADADADRRDLIRRAMVGIFTELGTDHPLAREHRRRLAALVN